MNCAEIMQWQRAIRAEKNLTHLQRTVAQSIALRVNQDGECWPSIATLATDSHCGETAARGAIRQLVRLGLLEVAVSPGRVSNTYRPINPSPSRRVEDQTEELNPSPSRRVEPSNPSPRRTPTPRPGEPKSTKRKEEEYLLSGKCPTRQGVEPVSQEDAPPPGERATKVPIRDVEEVIGYLNEKAGTAFEVRNRDGKLTSGAEAARQRVAEHGLEKIKAVIDQKATEWLGTERSIYLRPATLFRRSNAENYVGQLGLKPPPAPCPRGGYAPPEPSGAAYRPFTFD